MAISLQTGLKQSQKLAMTQSLKQAIEILQLSTIELYERISSELVDNPMLEEDAPAASVLPATETSNTMEGVSRSLSGDDPAFSREEERRVNYEDASDSGYSSEGDYDKKRNYLENITIHEESLPEHLMSQARLSACNERELVILQSIITSLNENGFLDCDPLAQLSPTCTDEEAMKALSAVQLFDPVGCAVGCVRESLEVQCRSFYPDDHAVLKIVTEHFDDFEKLDYRKISRSMGLPLAEVLVKGRIIQNLDPYPGRRYSTKTVRYIVPDVDVKLVDGEIIVTLNDDWVPGLRINSYYISLFKKKNIEKKLREYIQDKMQSGRYLIKNISNRRATILKVAGSIMERQRDFLQRGPGHLKPLTHSDVAKEVGLHESTVSRAVSNKYIQTCWGLFEMKFFFASRMKSPGGCDTSSDEVINLLRHIIDSESAARPYSDEEIVKIIGKAGIHVARRTVAKYRGILHIPPSSKRKKINKIKSEEHT